MKSEGAEEAQIDNLGKKLPEQKTCSLRGRAPSSFAHLGCACQSLEISTLLPEAACTTRSHQLFRMSHRAVSWILGVAELWYCQGLEIQYFYAFFSHMHVLVYQ
uniref:Uncharacterized protein n=1 Tax=Setaria italica TaxID=4555 RepID=K3Y0Y3_SETIT